MDSVDLAQADFDRAMERFERAQKSRVDLPGQTHCVYCDGEIPEARRVHVPGVETCVGCQSKIERGIKP